MVKTLKIYYLDEDYISYLRQFDPRVAYNKNKTRPYVGVVYTFHGQDYFAPLSSPKSKHLKMSEKAIDVFKIDSGNLGVVNLNNMIPTPSFCLTEVLPTVKDVKYRTLIENQTTFLNDNKSKLFTKVKRFWLQFEKEVLPSKVKDRCCNFILLEEKCKDYVQNFINV